MDGILRGPRPNPSGPERDRRLMASCVADGNGVRARQGCPSVAAGELDRAEIAVGRIAIWNVRRDGEVQGRSNLGGARDNRIAANMPAVVACDHQDVRFLAVDA